jgi:hypothetical protein
VAPNDACLPYRDSEKGGGQEARSTEIERYHRTIWTLLEISWIDIARAKAQTGTGIVRQVNPPIFTHMFEDLPWP